MAQGKIKFFDPKKGYGFITLDEPGRDVFLHASELFRTTGQKSLPDGTTISFDIVTKEKGPSATNVRIVG